MVQFSNLRFRYFIVVFSYNFKGALLVLDTLIIKRLIRVPLRKLNDKFQRLQALRSIIISIISPNFIEEVKIHLVVCVLQKYLKSMKTK